MTESEFIAAVAEVLGPLAKAPENPEGGEGFSVEGERKPYMVLCDELYEFATAEEAIAKAWNLQAMV